MTPPSPTSVLVGMSGGVDSSVAALRLLERGLRVEGATMMLLGTEVSADAEDAAQVCHRLGIKHHVLDFSDCFDRKVVDRFCQLYLQGKTPNPCIDCNRFLKFGMLLDYARSLGLDAVATGHYARITYDEERKRWLLKRGADESKDQSYVLYHLSQDALAHTLLPLGDITKQHVRDLARKHGFTNAEKGESQDICFVPDGDYASFIAKRTGDDFEAGDIVDIEGNVLGRHNGLAHYTIGQRKGIGVAAGVPLYVCEKNVERNELVVGTDDQAICHAIEVSGMNLITQAKLDGPLSCTVKTHYRQKPRPATIAPTQTGVRVEFDQPQRTCAPGQAAVFYQGDLVVGGGTTERNIF